jgi:hypothetical protein
MNIIKKWICKLFGLSNDLNDLDLYKRKCEFYQTDYEIAQTIIESYKRDLGDKEHQIEELRKMNEDPVTYVENALKASTEAYERCVADMDNLMDEMERVEHKAYARGRMDAYAEMGIKALDARMNGETLYYGWDGNIIEEMDAKDFRNFCEENEIELGDVLTRDE